MVELTLTPDELAAKNYIMKMMREALTLPCDIGTVNDIEQTIPKWMDADKCKRGQKYFLDNRFGILASNFSGLLTLLAEPKGLKILSETGRSGTRETAKKRYASTVMHTMSWYEYDFTPGSKSWDSLKRVRNLHLSASNASFKKNTGYITQNEVAITTFGFMGFALVRPHLLGIRHDNDDDREAFVHLWAVMCHLLGVRDEYNVCLLPLKVVEIVFQFYMRYIFMPLLQMETPLFKEMVNALLEGMRDFMPHMTYDLQMFTVRQLIGIPGYQYGVDLSKETICKPLFTSDEFILIHKLMCSVPGYEHFKELINEGVPLIDIKRGTRFIHSIDKRNIANQLDNMDSNQNLKGTYRLKTEIQHKMLHKYLGLSDDDDVNVRFTDNNVEWCQYLNDAKFYELSKMDQFTVRLRLQMRNMLDTNVGRYLLHTAFTYVLYAIKKFNNSKKGEVLSPS